MDKNDKRIEQITGRLKDTSHILDSNEKINEELCKDILDDLDTLHDLRKEFLMEEAMNTSIEELITEFNEKSEESKQFLNQILNTIAEGRVPDPDTLRIADATIEQLRDRYEEIAIFAGEVLTDDEVPDVGSAVTDYIIAINSSKSMLTKRTLESIRETLDDFAAVFSLAEMFAAALEPFQGQARELLERIEKEEIDVESVIEQSSKAKVFMNAFLCDNYSTPEGASLLKEVSEDIDFTVSMGLMNHSYFLHKERGEKEQEKLDEPESIEEDTSLSEDPVDKGPDGALSKIIQSDSGATNSLPTSDRTEEKQGTEGERSGSMCSVIAKTEQSEALDNSEKQSAHKDEKTESELVRKIHMMGLMTEDALSEEKVEMEVGSGEEKKITSTIFVNDLRKGNTKLASRILSILCDAVMLTESYIVLATGASEDMVNITLGYLIKKGYLRRYSIKKGDVLCVSPKLIKAVGFKEASKFISVQQNCLSDGEFIHETFPEFIAGALARSNVLEMLHKERDPQSTSYKLYIKKRTFAVRVAYDHDDKEAVLLCGAFWPEAEEWDKLFDTLREHFETYPGITSIIVTGVDEDATNGFARLMKDVLGDVLPDAVIRGYSLEDDSEIIIDNDHDKKDDIKAEGDLEKNEYPDEDDTEKVIDPEKKDELSVVPVTDNSTVYDVTASLLSDGMYYAALAYAKAVSIDNNEYNQFYKQLAYAMNDPAAFCNYSSDSWFNLIGSGNNMEDALMIAFAMRLFFSDQVRYDHNLKAVYSAISEYDMLEIMPPLKNLLYEMSEFKIRYKAGLDRYADYRKRSQNELDKEIRETKIAATEFYNKTIIGNKKEKTNHRRFIETMKMIFSPSGRLGDCMKFVVDGDKDAKSTVEEFLKDTFCDEDAEVSESTVNDELVWEYIQNYWDIAGEKMSTRKRDDLKGHLKTNIINSTTRAVQILARWCSLVADLESHDEDEGEIAYKKLRPILLEKIAESVNDIISELDDTGLELSEKAGLSVVNNTLSELQSRINGDYSEAQKRFFYKDFLLTDDVMLNENFMPDLECFSSNLSRITPQYRILDHAKKLRNSSLRFEDRLREILDEQGDDYGEAKLIVDYLSIAQPDVSFEKQYSEIDAGEAYARETAELRRVDFIGELELAQSYGQIDNSTENQKEAILKSVDDWYDWAAESSNYGFFKKVINEYMLDIRRNAKIREKDILAELERYRKATSTSLSVEEKGRKITKIQAAIKEQNYTVAEDLIRRNDAGEDGIESLVEEDFLKDFLNNYDVYYNQVANKNSSFASLVKNRTRNKEERGAKRLADNWLPGGSSLGKLRLETLLNTLGFDVEEIKEQKTIGRFEEYIVRTVGAFKRQRNSYTHPIAALGSGMAEEGLRVVCLMGSYDADGLIDIMKQIGNAKPTLILLDCALSLVERRKLARKTKNSLGDKLFAVLDRTAMMYLVRNYDETKINRMMVSIIVPFAYYQPYVWESANVMPPEIFMGRKFELEKIKSPTGVNIVYGGRQLGKSALLKKAKEDIDWDENGDRAIYIDIKGLDYKAAARKISHELYDQFVLKEDLDTTDWDVLTRALKKRLQSDADRIPYLLLLLDEADTFIDSCAAVNYRPFDSLKELQNIGVGRFKFVIAGLRDIVRFKRDALKNNSVLTHLEPMTVTPFKFSEARELMEIPLHYLGLRFPEGKESLLTLIMATTNYFPGLIQLYCAKLVDAMRNRDYAGYDVVDSPIYEVNEEHIKKVLADPDFMDQIREKFNITLQLDEDNYYYLIALTMAWLYHNEGLNASYTANDIKRVGEDFGIKKLAESDIDKLENLMEELKDLNVLRDTEDKHFRFTRFTFFQMMGTSDEVDGRLLDNMEE